MFYTHVASFIEHHNTHELVSIVEDSVDPLQVYNYNNYVTQCQRIYSLTTTDESITMTHLRNLLSSNEFSMVHISCLSMVTMEILGRRKPQPLTTHACYFDLMTCTP